MEQKKKRPSTLKLMKKFLPYYKPYWLIVVFDLMCAALTTVCEMVLPLIIKHITNSAISGTAALVVTDVLKLGLLYLLLKVVDTFLDKIKFLCYYINIKINDSF